MEQALRALLIDKNGVHESTVEYLEKNKCLTLANLANWVDDKKEIKDIHAKCPKRTTPPTSSPLSKRGVKWMQPFLEE